MRLPNQNIRWSEQCGDPGSRVFFKGERVFRAYDELRRQETLDFLNSKCYEELLENGMVVRTWVADDVSIDGYPLILEHERLSFMPETWFPYEMLKDVLAFHIEVNALCRKYGYGVRDVGYGNVTFKNGKLCFSDFGSFQKVETIDNWVYMQHGMPLAFLPISMYSSNDGNDFLAESLLVNYSKWGASYCEPMKDNLLHDRLRAYLYPIIDHYDVYWRARYFHIKIKSRASLGLVNLLNAAMKSVFFKHPADWQFIKIQNVYSEQKVTKALQRIASQYTGEPIHPIEENHILQRIPEVIKKHSGEQINRVVLWGNFSYEELLALRASIDSEIVVMSNDRVYTNQLYKKIIESKTQIWVVCCNAIRGNDFSILKRLKCDLLVMQDGIYEYARQWEHSDWAEKTSYFASSILVHEIDKEEYDKTKMQNFWTLKEDNNQYKLFVNNAENGK